MSLNVSGKLAQVANNQQHETQKIIGTNCESLQETVGIAIQDMSAIVDNAVSKTEK